MLKSLNLKLHAKAGERNAGFRGRRRASVPSLSPPESYTERGEPFCLLFAARNFFPQFLGIFPHTSGPFGWIPLYRSRPLPPLLCYQIGDLGKSSFLIEDLQRWYVPKWITLQIWTIWCECETLNVTFTIAKKIVHLCNYFAGKIGSCDQLAIYLFVWILACDSEQPGNCSFFCIAKFCEDTCCLLLHWWSLPVEVLSFGNTDWHGWSRF